MDDFAFFTRPAAIDRTTIFVSATPLSTAANDWQKWHRPRAATMIQALIIGAGGGGANGSSGASGTNRAGGGGGGSGAVMKALFPASLCPEVLYVRPGKGGDAATSGTFSFVAFAPSNAQNAYLLLEASGGSGATTVTGGTQGAGDSLTTKPLTAWGFLTSSIGQAGTAGGTSTGAAGTAAVVLNSHFLTGGTGGGSAGASSVSYAGGAITGKSGYFPDLAGGVAGGGAGSHGIWRPEIWAGTGGTGGGSSFDGVGGAGGNGAYGCGGGGGGAGVTGGAGGKGGDALIMITWW